MKFGELSIIGKDKNSQNLNISIRFITIIYILFTVLFLIYTKYVNSLSRNLILLARNSISFPRNSRYLISLKFYFISRNSILSP